MTGNFKTRLIIMSIGLLCKLGFILEENQSTQSGSSFNKSVFMAVTCFSTQQHQSHIGITNMWLMLLCKLQTSLVPRCPRVGTRLTVASQPGHKTVATRLATWPPFRGMVARLDLLQMWNCHQKFGPANFRLGGPIFSLKFWSLHSKLSVRPRKF